MSYRKIEVNGREWRWKAGQEFLDIRSPEGKGYRPRKSAIGESTADPDDPWSFLDEVHKVTPGHIRKYIEGLHA